MKIHKLITETDELEALCERLATKDWVAVDTEFMRENTYWPELCLIQIASVDEAAAIDPLADNMDMSALLDLLVENQDVLKVVHAGGQDLEGHGLQHRLSPRRRLRRLDRRGRPDRSLARRFKR